MRNYFKPFAVILALLFLNTFGVVAHASAMPMADHGMDNMSEGANAESSLTCATLCRTAVSDKEDIVILDKEEDDEPNPSYTTQFQRPLHFVDTRHATNSGTVSRPPPKVPLYVLYGIFRS